MKLSIIIPAYNEENTVAEILKRVLGVELSGIAKEVIVVDDGSIDKTVGVVEIITGKNKNIQLINFERCDLSDARYGL